MNAQKLCTVWCCLMVTVFFLGMGPKGYAAATGTKYLLFLILHGALLLGLGLCAVTGRLKSLRRPGIVQLLVLLYWLASLISALCSPWRRETLLGGPRDEGLLSITLYVSAFLALSCLAGPDRLLLPLLAGAVTLDCVVALLQFAGLDPFWLYPGDLGWADRFTLYNGAFTGLSGNADFSAAILAMAFPVCWIAALRLRRPLYLVPAALALTVLVLGGTRGGLLGAAAGSLLVLPEALPCTARRRRSLRIALLILILLGLAALWLLPLPGTLGEAHALLRGQAEDSFGSGRIYIWRNTLPLLRERLLTGGGPDTFGRRMTAHFTRVLEDGRVLRRSIDCAHNEYLNLLVCQGLPALLLLCAAGCITLLRIRRKYKLPALLAGSALLCYALQAFFGISTPTCTAFFWMAWGLAEGYLRASQAPPPGETGPDPAPPEASEALSAPVPAPSGIDKR